MRRFRGVTLALVLAALALPAQLVAQQEPKDSKYTRDAEKFLGLAMMRGDGPERQQMYQDALAALQEGFERDAQNPKLWFVAGQAYAGLGQLNEAQEAFDRAVELYPDYAADVEAEKEAAWMVGFEQGVALMDQQQYDQAIATFEAANALFPNRPEAYLNLGNLYAGQGNLEKAVEALERARDAATGPTLEKLQPEAQEQWRNYAEMAEVNIAQMLGQRGVDAFQAGNYQEAEQLFRRAVEVNPHSRDFLFNIVQSRYAQATAIEERLEQDSAAASQPNPELLQLYEGLQGDVAKVQQYDPNNETLYLILARSHKRGGELAGDSTAAQQNTLRVLTELEAMPVEVSELAINPADGTASITGKVRNRKLAAGTPVTIRLTLLARDGSTIGEQQVTVNAPEPEQTADFEATATTTGQVAGWKYEVNT